MDETKRSSEADGGKPFLTAELEAKFVALCPVAQLDEISNRIGSWYDVGTSEKDYRFLRQLEEFVSIASRTVRDLVDGRTTEGVAVSKLVWKDGSADTPFGVYTVAEDPDDLWRWTFHRYPYGSPDDDGHPDEAAAMAGAQADFDGKIRSVASASGDAVSGRTLDLDGADVGELLTKLPLVKHRLGAVGLLKTMHAMEAAVTAIGWEVAETSTGLPSVGRAKP